METTLGVPTSPKKPTYLSPPNIHSSRPSSPRHSQKFVEDVELSCGERRRRFQDCPACFFCSFHGRLFEFAKSFQQFICETCHLIWSWRSRSSLEYGFSTSLPAYAFPFSVASLCVLLELGVSPLIPSGTHIRTTRTLALLRFLESYSN